MTDTITSTRYGELTIGNMFTRGGQGSIWKTDDPDILLKRFEPSFIADDPGQQHVLRCHAEKAFPAFCAVNKGHQAELRSLPREYLTVRGNPSYLMQKADGALLQTLMREQKIPPDQKVPLAHALARAMKKLHRAQLVHADINPENFIVRHDLTGFTVFVLDIDAGGLHGPPGPIYPMASSKRIYKAPELCAMGWPQLYDRCLFFAPDAWALAVLLYQILVDYQGPFCSVKTHPDPAVTDYRPFPPYAYRDPAASWPQPWQEALLAQSNLSHEVVSLFYATFARRFLFDEKKRKVISVRPTASDWEKALCPPPPALLTLHAAVFHTPRASQVLKEPVLPPADPLPAPPRPYRWRKALAGIVRVLHLRRGVSGNDRRLTHAA
jgi:serine/threonine protein kinase